MKPVLVSGDMYDIVISSPHLKRKVDKNIWGTWLRALHYSSGLQLGPIAKVSSSSSSWYTSRLQRRPVAQTFSLVL